MNNQNPQDVATSLWTQLLTDVKSGATTISQATDTIKSITTAINDVNSLTQPSIGASVASNFPHIIPIIDGLASKIGIGGLAEKIGMGAVVGASLVTPAGLIIMGGAVLALLLMSTSHGMKSGSPEEKAWFDRASGGPSAH